VTIPRRAVWAFVVAGVGAGIWLGMRVFEALAGGA
jgi:hypothetical protein